MIDFFGIGEFVVVFMIVKKVGGVFKFYLILLKVSDIF